MPPDAASGGPHDSAFVEIPHVYLPEGVGGSSYDPVVLRAVAEAQLRHPGTHEMPVKAWVVLHLLDHQVPPKDVDAVADPEGLLRIYGLTLLDLRKISAEMRQWQRMGGRETTLRRS